MMNHHVVSDELLNAFVDDELVLEEKNELFDSIERDDALKARVCELRGLKEMVQHTYQQPASGKMAALPKRRDWSRYVQTLAASLFLLFLGGIFGWNVSEKHDATKYHKVLSLFKIIQNNNIKQEPGRIIVQVSDANPLRLKTALDETESLLKSYRQANQKSKIEIIASGGGLDLLRSDVTHYKERISMLQKEYPNLDIVGCNQSITELQKKGVVVTLLPNIRVASSALDEINMRLQQGWDYVRV
jgi:uncharacterized protein